MPSGFSVHVGVSRVDAVRYGTGITAAGSDRAAHAWRDLARSRGFHTLCLTDQRADAAAVLGAFQSAADALRDHDFLLLTFAGHGVDSISGGGDDQRTEPYDQGLLCYDSVILDDDIYEVVKSISCPARVLIIADACASGSIATAPLSPRARPGDRPERPWLYRIHFGHGRLFAQRASRTMVTANVLLLAAAEEHGVARRLADGAPGLPPFSAAALACLSSADDYRAWYTCVSTRAHRPPGFPQPVFNRSLLHQPEFLLETPLAI